ncbi:MAG: aminoacyl-tRNA hydrolase [Candidatus Jorgensenbacteria bacterium]|nr:aminoacyl-tRNA hydrolase [Candidatus Jorgensenbacteria bacterium]
MKQEHNPIRNRRQTNTPTTVFGRSVSNGASPLLIVGLGNPGEEFKNTYHNVGGEALQYIRKHFGMPAFKKITAKQFMLSKSEDAMLILPLVFMNESGNAVREALRYFKLNEDALLVIHDDTDLSIGSWKESRSQGAAGHNGVASIITALSTKNFRRVRIGVRPEFGGERKKAEEFVLRPIAKSEQKILEGVFEEIAGKIFPGASA